MLLGSVVTYSTANAGCMRLNPHVTFFKCFFPFCFFNSIVCIPFKAQQCDYWSAPRSRTTLNMCCWTVYTGFWFRNASSSSCVCWHSRHCMDSHRRIEPICASCVSWQPTASATHGDLVTCPTSRLLRCLVIRCSRSQCLEPSGCKLDGVCQLRGRHYSDRLCSDRRYSDSPQSRRPSTSLAPSLRHT